MIVDRNSYVSDTEVSEIIEKINGTSTSFSGHFFIELVNPVYVYAKNNEAIFSTHFAKTKMNFIKKEIGTTVQVVTRPSLGVLIILSIITLMILSIFVIPEVKINGISNAPYYKRLPALGGLIIPAIFIAVSMRMGKDLEERVVDQLDLKKIVENGKQHSK